MEQLLSGQELQHGFCGSAATPGFPHLHSPLDALEAALNALEDRTHHGENEDRPVAVSNPSRCVERAREGKMIGSVHSCLAFIYSILSTQLHLTSDPWSQGYSSNKNVLGSFQLHLKASATANVVKWRGRCRKVCQTSEPPADPKRTHFTDRHS